MDNVAFSCLLAMANVAVSDCRDGLCRSGLWARCILTHSHEIYAFIFSKSNQKINLTKEMIHGRNIASKISPAILYRQSIISPAIYRQAKYRLSIISPAMGRLNGRGRGLKPPKFYQMHDGIKLKISANYKRNLNIFRKNYEYCTRTFN